MEPMGSSRTHSSRPRASSSKILARWVESGQRASEVALSCSCGLAQTRFLRVIAERQAEPGRLGNNGANSACCGHRRLDFFGQSWQEHALSGVRICRAHVKAAWYERELLVAFRVISLLRFLRLRRTTAASVPVRWLMPLLSPGRHNVRKLPASRNLPPAVVVAP